MNLCKVINWTHAVMMMYLQYYPATSFDTDKVFMLQQLIQEDLFSDENVKEVVKNFSSKSW